MSRPLLACACIAAVGLTASTTRAAGARPAFDAMDPVVPFAPMPGEGDAGQTAGAPPGEELPPPDSLDALIARASRANPALRAAWHEYRAAVRQMPAARKLPEPTITYSFHALPVETRVGPMQHQLGVSQAIPWPARLGAAANVAAAETLIRRRKLEALQAQVRRDIRRPWADLAMLDRARELLRQEDDLLASVEEIIRARLSVGQASYEVLTRVGLRRIELREREQTLADQEVSRRAHVRAVADLEPGAPLPAASFEEIPAELPSPAELAAGLESHPDVVTALAKIRRAQAGVEAAEADRMPDFGIGISWTVVGSARMAGVADSGTDALMLTASARIPFWFDAYEANEDAARARVQAAEAGLESVRRQAEATLVELTSAHREAARRASLYERELIPGAESALESTLGAFAADRATFTDVLEVEQQLLRYRLGVAEARRAAIVATADLEWLFGGRVEAGANAEGGGAADPAGEPAPGADSEAPTGQGEAPAVEPRPAGDDGPPASATEEDER